ncbi:hypothetical protein BASA61_006718 [Batrachochytrium salamandrivorans]|nr:hypothetical protein BASA61_006718 [Batrachochytrium salamandrivorans]
MYEFVGAVTARSAMVEGAANQISTISACIGMLVMQGVAWYTGEDIELYAMVLIKFVVAWLTLGGLLGGISAIASGFRFQADWNPRTRAWPSGPVCLPFFMSLREVGSALVSLFVPMSPTTQHILKYGVGYVRFGISVAVLIVIMTGSYMYLDSRAAVAAASGGANRKKQKKAA